jgi:hypothetical protein
MTPTGANLYSPPTVGYFIYHARKNGQQRWAAHRRYAQNKTRSALCYSFQDARTFLDALPTEYTPNPDATYHH